MTNPFLGLIAIIILDILVGWYMVKSWNIVRTSSILFIPYALWLILATYLNVYIYLYN